MKISFPKYGPDELLTQKRLVTCIISFVALAVFAGALGSYLVANKLWLLTIAVLGIAGILLCLGAAVAIFLNQNKLDEAPSAPIEEYVPRLTSQWDYRPRKAIRARAALDSPSTETADGLTSDSIVTNNNVWCNDDSPECATPTFIDRPSDAEETITKPLPQTSDPMCATPTVDDGGFGVRRKSYRQSSRRR
jgi:hypothetical protein